MNDFQVVQDIEYLEQFLKQNKLYFPVKSQQPNPWRWTEWDYDLNSRAGKLPVEF